MTVPPARNRWDDTGKSKRHVIGACLVACVACGGGGAPAHPAGDASGPGGNGTTTGEARRDAGGRGDSGRGDAGAARHDGAIPPDSVTMFGAETGFALTSGGGSGRSKSLQLQIAIGAPQPQGSGASANLRLRLGGAPIR